MKSPRIQPRYRRCIPDGVDPHVPDLVVRRGGGPDVDLEADEVRGDLELRRDGHVALEVAAELAIILTAAGRGRGPRWGGRPAREASASARPDGLCSQGSKQGVTMDAPEDYHENTQAKLR